MLMSGLLDTSRITSPSHHMIERTEIMAQAADEETSPTRGERGGEPATVDRRPATSTARGWKAKLAKQRVSRGRAEGGRPCSGMG